MKQAMFVAALLAVVVTVAQAQPAQLSTTDRKSVDALIEAGLEDERSYSLLESLTTEIGPRLGGTEAEARARNWAVAKLKALGFEKVRIETFEMPSWRRISESAAIASPFPQPVHVAALGNSVSTPKGGVTAEVVRFESMADFEMAPAGSVDGKLVFIDERMTRTQDGSGYGVAVVKRSAAAYEAAKRGAVAAIIRSVGTDTHRNPHTGNMRLAPEGPPSVPAAALSNPDADQLARAIKRAKEPVRLTLDIKTERLQQVTSGNVIGEIRGRTDEIVVVGGHLDSWDLGTGAVDDGAGVAIAIAAAKLVDELGGKPQRTIRVVLWGAEEVGLHGAKAYAAAHAGEFDRHALAMESDFGAGRVWSISTRFGERSAEQAALFAAALHPLGVGPGSNDASGGPDVGPLRTAGVPVLDLNQDGADYFDYHHTPDDTLDKVDPEALKQNVAAMAATLYLASELSGGFRE